MFKPNYSKTLDYYFKLPEFKNQRAAEKYFFKLKDNCLKFIAKLKDKDLDFSAESLIYLESFYKQLEENDGYKKVLDISKDQFRRVFGIYVKEVYVKHRIARWTVERFLNPIPLLLG